MKVVERLTGRDQEPVRHASKDGYTPMCPTRARDGYYEITFPATRPATVGDVDCRRCRRIIGSGS